MQCYLEDGFLASLPGAMLPGGGEAWCNVIWRRGGLVQFYLEEGRPDAMLRGGGEALCIVTLSRWWA